MGVSVGLGGMPIRPRVHDSTLAFAKRDDFLDSLAPGGDTKKLLYRTWVIYLAWLRRVPSRKIATPTITDPLRWIVAIHLQQPCCKDRGFVTSNGPRQHAITMKHLAYVVRQNMRNQHDTRPVDEYWPDIERDIRAAYRYRRKWYKVHQTMAAIDGIKL